MSITTYAELQTALTSWLGGRTDLTTYYPDWITMFESVANRRLRIRPMQAFATVSTVNGEGFLPTDYLAVIECYHNDTQSATGITPLQYTDLAFADTFFPSYPTGVARYFNVFNLSITVFPSEDTDFGFLYYQKIPNLADNSTNWLLDSHPDLYLFGSLAEGHFQLADDQLLATAKARRDEVFDELEKQNFRQQTQLVQRVASVTP
jgi:hypothetical protein